MIIKTQDRIRLLEIQAKYIKSNEIGTYLKACSELIVHRFNQDYEGRLKYLDLFRFSQRKDAFIGLSESNFDYDRFFPSKKEAYDFVKGLINEKEVISLTKALMSLKNAGIYFSYDSDHLSVISKEIPDMICMNLDTIVPDHSLNNIKESGFEQFYRTVAQNFNVDQSTLKEFTNTLKFKGTGDPSKVKNILLFHRLCHPPEENVHIYFIRPRTNHSEFDGTLHICVIDPLTVAEIEELSSLLKDILFETAIVKIERLTKDSEWRNISQEQSHGWNHEMGALKNSIVSLKACFNQRNSHVFEEVHSSALQHHSMLLEINSFNLMIMRYGERGENSKIEDNIKNELSPGPISLSSTLNMAIDTLINSLSMLDMEDDKKKSVIEQCIPTIKDDITKIDPNIRVSVLHTALKIIFFDLLKNAVFYSGDPPKVNIKLEQNRKGQMCLYFINNRPPDSVLISLVKKRKLNMRLQRFRAGIRTVQRYISLPYFNSSKVGWALRISPDRKQTILFLKFPKTDIVS